MIFDFYSFKYKLFIEKIGEDPEFGNVCSNTAIPDAELLLFLIQYTLLLDHY